jgi:alpha-beta hydrolase superfamily lysophospholipase
MADLGETTETFAGTDGVDIFYRRCQPPDERARLVIAHGLGEHSGRYRNVSERLLPKGIGVWALDHRGHGRSGGPRGHVRVFDEYLEDLGTLIDLCKADAPAGRRCFLLGHSMGGLIALAFVLRSPEVIDGVIASSPGLGLTQRIPAIKGVLGRIMSSVWPSLSLGNELDPSLISRDEDTVRAYQNDPLVHDRVTARWLTEFLSAMESTNRMASEIEIPILMQVAGDDRLVNPESSKAFFEKIAAEDKTLHVYEGLYHEVYNEREDDRAKVLADL